MPTPLPVTDEKALARYQTDESAAYRGTATELYLPETEAQVIAVIRDLNRSRTRFTVAGSGTGITGARCPVYGGAVIAMDRLARPQAPCPEGAVEISRQGYTIYLNAAAKTAIAPAGILLSVLDGMLAEHGLLYPPDPTEMTAMLGGTVATNASGARSFFYGPTRAWIQALRIVLPTGHVLSLRRGEVMADGSRLVLDLPAGRAGIGLPAHAAYPMPDVKNAAGLYLKAGMDALDLFIGCEGILGCFTDVTVRLTERIERTLTVVGYFATEDDALSFVDAGAGGAAPLHSLSLEYFDERALDFIRTRYPDVPQAAAAVLFEVPYGGAVRPSPFPDLAALRRIDAALGACRAAGNWSVPWHNRDRIRLFRHALPEAVNEYVRTRSGKVGTDMAVPHARLRDMMACYRRMSAEAGVPYVLFGHIGNDHLHLNYLPADAGAARRAKLACARLARCAVDLGGTVSAEHGVGKKTALDPSGAQVPYLQIMYGPTGLVAIAAVKKRLDPLGLMNAGNMIPAGMLAGAEG